MFSDKIQAAFILGISSLVGAAYVDLSAWKQSYDAHPGIAFNWSLAVNRWAASFALGFVSGLALGSQGSP